VTPLRRLIRYAAPYRGRFGIALVAMALYGAGSAWLAWLVKPIVNDVLIRQQALAMVAWSILGAYC